MYADGSSAVACGAARYVTASIKVGPSPARARATVSRVASYTARTSPPSTRTPGIPYPTALSARVSAAVCASSGVEIAHWLLLQKSTSGARITAAKLAPSWKEPSEVAPSPKYTIAQADSPRSFFPQASPAACGTCVPIGTQIEATFQSAGFHQPAGCPRHQESTVDAGMPRSSPIADSRYDGKIQSSSSSACTAPACIASWFQKIAYVPTRPWRWYTTERSSYVRSSTIER